MEITRRLSCDSAESTMCLGKIRFNFVFDHPELCHTLTKLMSIVNVTLCRLLKEHQVHFSSESVVDLQCTDVS